MPPNQTYSNLYTIGFLATLGMMTFGMYYFYSGMGEVSYRTYSGFETVTYYLDKQKYDLYFNGLIYCGCFCFRAPVADCSDSGAEPGTVAA